MNAQYNRALFLRWAAQKFPQAYAGALDRAAQPPGPLGDVVSSITGFFDSFANSITSLAQTYSTAQAQVDWLKLNAQRAKNGLPPLDPATGQPVASSMLPAPAAYSQAAQVEGHLTSSASQGVPGWLWIVGAGVLAVVVSRAL